MWLANGIPGEFGYISWQVELSMSYVAGQRHSLGKWLHVLASRIWYVLYGWSKAFLRQIELGMCYVAG